MRTSPRWLVPIAVAAVVATGAAVGSAQADSTPRLTDRAADRTPQQVLAAIAASDITALSGTVVTRADLGLPTAASSGGPPGHGGTSTDPQAVLMRFLTGQNTLRLWTDGPTRHRVQLLDPFDELNMIRNGDQLWTYSARRNEVGRGSVPERSTGGNDSRPHALPSGAGDLTPTDFAQRLLSVADPTTSVTLGTPAVVAGRAAHSLTMTPRSDRTLLDRIVIAVDAENGVPLQVQVFARGHRSPAVTTGFTSVDFSRPDPSRFAFTPPKGSRLTDLTELTELTDLDTVHAPRPEQRGERDRPEVHGEGWASVLEVPAKERDNAGGPAAESQALLDQLLTPVNGGRVMSTRLFSVLVTDDGRTLAGAVPVEVLVEAARR